MGQSLQDLISDLHERVQSVTNSATINTTNLAALTAVSWIIGSLTASDAAAGVFSWHNTLGVDVVVTRVLVQVKTIATAACTLDIGEAATNILSDNLVDGVDVHAATGVFDNLTSAGTNGKSQILVPSGAYVTGSMATGATAGLVGRYALAVVAIG